MNKNDQKLTDMDLMLLMLQRFDIDYTITQDEAGATIEFVVGNRKVGGTRGNVASFNFGSADRDEKFLFTNIIKMS